MHQLLAQTLEFTICSLVGTGLAIPLLYLNIRFAEKLGFMDFPKARGMTEHSTPVVGPTLLLLCLLGLGLAEYFFDLGPWLPLTSFIIGLMGLLDDRKPLSAADKLFIQGICISIVFFLDDSLRNSIQAQYGPFGAVIGALFVLGIVNAVNFVDGIDGLAGSVLLFAALGLCGMSSQSKELHSFFLLGAFISGALLPFLHVNVRLRKGFLGNVGSYFLSFLLVNLHLRIQIPSHDILSRLSLTGLCFIVPIADSLMVITSRLFSLRSPFQADKGHLHHRLIQTSVPLRWILSAFGLVSMGAVALSIVLTANPFLSNTIFPTVVCIIHTSITTLLILLIDRASRRRIQSYFERLDSGQPIYYLKYRVVNKNGSLLAPIHLRRLEARIGAEIRVSDYCFTQNGDTIFIVLKTLIQPLKGIAGRIETIFLSEQILAELTQDQGEFVKIQRNQLLELQSA